MEHFALEVLTAWYVWPSPFINQSSCFDYNLRIIFDGLNLKQMLVDDPKTFELTNCSVFQTQDRNLPLPNILQPPRALELMAELDVLVDIKLLCDIFEIILEFWARRVES
jgi:hypothetical protein